LITQAVDAELVPKEGAVHSAAETAANVTDCHMLHDLLYGEEHKV